MSKHKKDCQCPFCKTKRGGIAHHKPNCQCCVCQNIRGEWRHSQATKDKISIAAKKVFHYWGVSGTTGKHHSEETKEKIRQKALSRPSRKGLYHLSEKAKKNISLARLKFYENGGVVWNKGITKDDPRYLSWVSKTTKRRLAVVCKRPNHFEAEVGEYLNKLFPNRFEYVGNGSVLINGKSPDYIDRKQKIVVLCHGLYWHLLRYGLEDTQENRRMIELSDSKLFIEKGYDVWFIWELTNQSKRFEEKIYKYVK